MTDRTKSTLRAAATSLFLLALGLSLCVRLTDNGQPVFGYSALGLALALALAVVLAPVLSARRRARSYRIVHTPSGRLRLPYDLDVESMLDNHRLLDKLADIVVKVCVIRNTFDDGGRYDSPLVTRFTSFVVLDDGDTLELEVGALHGEIDGRAKRLADYLEVPYEDTSYGG